MENKKYKLSKSPISDYKNGTNHQHKVEKLTFADMFALEDDYFPHDVIQALDTVYYHLLDNKALRKKWSNLK